jgi:two-component system, cell cycle sensor histidine kinase and response regulator CckA
MNAKNSLPHGGTIDLIASTGAANKDRVAIEVRDHDCGIDAQSMKRIFEPFFTTKKEGTGLGMTTAARFVERAGGSVEIESTPGVGIIVQLLIPLVGP